MYAEQTLSTGRTVEIRPLGWDEYWDIQKSHLLALKNLQEKSKSISDVDYTLALTDAQRASREAPLALCVNDWATLHAELSMPEVVELSEIIKSISKMGIMLGNSVPAAAADQAAELNTAAIA